MTDNVPTKEEIKEEMELHNADEAGIDNQWTLEDAEYHLLLSDKYHKPQDYCEIGMSRCHCGWSGDYPVSGCPKCHQSFVE